MDEIRVRDKRTGVIRYVTRKAYAALGVKVYERLSDEVPTQEPQVDEPQDFGSEYSGDEASAETPAAMEVVPAPAKKRGRKPKAISSDDAEEQ